MEKGKARGVAPGPHQGPEVPGPSSGSAFGGRGRSSTLRHPDGPLPPKAEQVKGSGAAGPSGVEGQSPSPTSTLLAAFAERASRPLARRQIEAGTPFALGRREGPYVWNLEGDRRLLDCATTGGVHALGHRNPEILAALQGALDDGYDGGIWTMPNAPLLALHDALAACAPSGLTRSVVTLCASQANDLAILCARRVTGRRGIVAFHHGYHGHLGAAAEATGSESEGIASHYALDRTNIRFFHRHGDLSEIDTLIDATTAAVIIEPFDYETWRLPPEGFLPALAEICRARGARLILDETRTGLGRSGRMWLCEHLGATPDMLVTGKGLSGGLYPVGALLMAGDIHEACINSHEYGWANSLAGNEIAATVALKVLEIAQRPETRANIAAIETRVRQRFGDLARRHQSVFTPATMLGGIATIGLVRPTHAARLSRLMFDHGVLMHSVSTTPPHVAKFLPVLTANPAIIDELAAALDQAAQELGK